MDEDTIASGEWPANWSLASFEDVGEFYKNELLKEEAAGAGTLKGCMSSEVFTTTPEAKTGDLGKIFEKVSGIPVVNDAGQCVGMIAKSDLRPDRGVKASTPVAQAMTKPPICISETKAAADAAVLMLKYKVNRLPVVDGKKVVIGVVTRTDVFKAMEE